VPAIPDNYLGAVVFLYPSREAAQRQEQEGESGFVGSFHHIGERPGPRFIVTNQHVTVKARVARLTDEEGEALILDTSPDSWHHHPAGDDVSVFPLVDLKPEEYERLPSITQTTFVEEKDYVRPGDDVFMLGRFIMARGKQLDAPTARFGHLAMQGTAPVPTERGIDQESFLVEALSIPGYSGSPVVAFKLHLEQNRVTGGISLAVGDPRGTSFGSIRSGSPDLPVLLGIDWGHITDDLPVLEPSGTPTSDKLYVRQNRGMIGVVPAWKITEILEDELADWKGEWERHVEATRPKLPGL
jgi:hypothetical protein